MPVTYTIDVARRLVLLRTEGRQDLDEWFARLDEAASHPEFGPGFSFLCDRTGTVDVPDAEMARAWATRYATRINQAGGGRLAVIVDQPVVYGMVRMAAIFAEIKGANVAVFYSAAEALEWLGRDSEIPAASTGP